MAAPLHDLERQQIVEFYATATVLETARRFHRKRETVSRILKASGVTVRHRHGGPARRVEQISGEALKQALRIYGLGVGLTEVARQIRQPITATKNGLLSAGVVIRDRGAQQQARMDRAGEDGRRRITAAANAAARGSRRPLRARIKAAKTQQRTCSKRSELEMLVEKMIRSRGADPIPQLAVGPYNCDLTFANVAVEIWGGKWHFSGHHARVFPARTAYLLNRGFHVLHQVISSADGIPLSDDLVDKLLAKVEILRGDEAPARQYRVIWGATERSSGGSSEDDQVSLVLPF